MTTLRTMLDMIASDPNISPAMRAAIKPAIRQTCPACQGKPADCIYCNRRGYTIVEKETPCN